MIKKGIFLIGTSNDIMESSFSSILRVLESFQINQVVLLYSSFAKRYAEKLKTTLEKLFPNGTLSVGIEEINEISYRNQFDAAFDEETLLCPTSGSRFYTIVSTDIGKAKGATLVHVMFPYGPWRELYYPFVPRFLQQIVVLSGDTKPLSEIKDIFDENNSRLLEEDWKDKIKGKNITKRVGMSSFRYNKLNKKNFVENGEENIFDLGIDKYGEIISNDTSNTIINLRILDQFKKYNLSISINDENRTDRDFPNSTEFRKNFISTTFGIKGINVSDDSKLSPFDIFGILGYLDIDCISLGNQRNSLEEISEQSKGIIIDTNMIYLGINLYKEAKIMVPYCAYIEIANKRTEMMKGHKDELTHIFADILWDALNELLESNPIVPTETFFCDGVIPMMDPLIIRNCTLLTNDEGAYQHWMGIFSDWVRVAKAKISKTSSVAKVVFALFLTSSVLQEGIS